MGIKFASDRYKEHKDDKKRFKSEFRESKPYTYDPKETGIKTFFRKDISKIATQKPQQSKYINIEIDDKNENKKHNTNLTLSKVNDKVLFKGHLKNEVLFSKDASAEEKQSYLNTLKKQKEFDDGDKNNFSEKYEKGDTTKRKITADLFKKN